VTGGPFFQPVAVEDVACCFTRALTEQCQFAKPSMCAGRINLTMPQILREILAATGRKKIDHPRPH